MAHQGRVIKRTFKTPEGRFQIHSERPNACNFNPAKPTRLTLAKLSAGSYAGSYVLFNLQEYVYVCPYSGTDKVPVCTINFNLAPSGSVMLPTCHAHAPARDGFDLLVGLSTGDVIVASLQAQLQASQTNTKLLSQLHFNSESSIDATRVIGVEWVPHTNGDLFVAAHSSGCVYTYSKASVSGTGGHFSAKTNGNLAPVSTLVASQKGLNAMALSPDGSRIATAGRDGVVRVHDLGSGALLTGFRTYYGNPICCTWSQDGQYIAAGGEDDLVAVFGMEEQRVVAWGEGHASWVSAVSFDPWVVRPSEGEAAAAPSASDGGDVDMEADASSEAARPASASTSYRLGSVGQDCQLCLWDIVVAAPRHRLAHASSSGPELNPRALRPPARQEPARRGWDSSVVREGSSPKLLAKLSSSLHRDSSPSAHHRSDSSSSSCLPPEILPATPRKHMHFIPAFAAIRCATEPVSDLIFTHDALFTACHGGSVKAWERLRPLPPLPTENTLKPEPSAAPAPQKMQEDAREAA